MVELKEIGIKGFDIFEKETWVKFPDLTVVTGRNGSGKSSYFRCLSYFMSASSDFARHSKHKNTFIPPELHIPISQKLGSKCSYLFKYDSDYFHDGQFVIEANYLLVDQIRIGYNTLELDTVQFYFLNSGEKKLIMTFESRGYATTQLSYFNGGLLYTNTRAKQPLSNKEDETDIVKAPNKYLSPDEFESHESELDKLSDDYINFIVLEKYLNIAIGLLKKYYPDRLNLKNNDFDNISDDVSSTSNDDENISDDIDYKWFSLKPVQPKWFELSNGIFDGMQPDLYKGDMIETIAVGLLYDNIKEYATREHDNIDSEAAKRDKVIADYRKKISSLKNGNYKTKLELKLFTLFPECLETITTVSISRLNRNFFKVSPLDLVSLNRLNSGPLFETIHFPISLPTRKTKNDLVGTTSFIDIFINEWLEKFDLGTNHVLDIREDQVSIDIIREGKSISFSILSYGQKQIVSLILFLASLGKPLRGMITVDWFIEAYSKEKLNIIPEWRYISENNLENLLVVNYLEMKINPLTSELNETMVYLEEPETFLHPNMQSLLADLIVDAINRFELTNLMIETHSEYFIRKIQYLVGVGKVNPEHVCVLYMDKDADEKVKDLELQKDGAFKRNFGEGFLDEATHWKFELLKAKNLN